MTSVPGSPAGEAVACTGRGVGCWMRFSRLACAVAATAVLAVGLGTPAQADDDDDTEVAGTTTTVEVPAGAESGVPTGITLASGDSVSITATGIARTNPGHPTTDPDGMWPGGGSARASGSRRRAWRRRPRPRSSAGSATVTGPWSAAAPRR